MDPSHEALAHSRGGLNAGRSMAKCTIWINNSTGYVPTIMEANWTTNATAVRFTFTTANSTTNATATRFIFTIAIASADGSSN